MEKIVQKKIVAAAILDNDKILIIQRSSQENLYPDMWELPSGKREELEDTNKALIREVLEETGLKVEIIKILSVFDYQINKGIEIRDATQINYLVKIIGNKKIKLSADHKNYSWVGLEDISKYDITKETINVIKQALIEK
jgi:8-oxo-dGTP diphosphatase